MQFFNSEKDFFKKNVAKKFDFKAFSRLILIRISTEFQLIYWYYLL